MNNDRSDEIPMTVKPRVVAPTEFPSFVLDEPSRFSLYVVDQVLAGLRTCARECPDKEVGGVLLGQHFRHGGRDVVVVSDYLPLHSRDTSAMHYVFDDSALLALHAHLAGTGGRVVGWFHSHIRLGDPFMSLPYDVPLHRAHFREPWQVSCVVAMGEWAMPIGCYRMDGEQLLEIGEYYVRMTYAKTAGEQCRRFFRACDAEERSLSNLIVTAKPILQDLGLDPDGPLGSALCAATKEEKKRADRSKVARPLMALIRLAADMAADPAVMGEIQPLQQALDFIRFLDDGLLMVIKTDSLQDRVAISGNKCCTLTRGQHTICFGDFAANVYIPLAFPPAYRFADVACGADDRFWLLASAGQLYRMHDPASLEADRVVAGQTMGEGISLPQLDSEAVELAMRTTKVWVRTHHRVVQYEIAWDKDLEACKATCLTSVPLPCGKCVLLPDERHGGMTLLGVVDEHLIRWDSSGRQLERTALPRHWNSWSLAGACVTKVGVLALLDDHASGQLARFGADSLRLIAHYVQDCPKQERQRLYSVCSDAMRRGYVRKGNALWLLEETGVASSEWYHHRLPRELRDA